MINAQNILILRDPLSLESGQSLSHVIIAYETYGKLNSSKSNVILIEHAFSGSAHAGSTKASTELGWWDNMIGPEKACDTNKYFIICSNVLGGCGGTTGPSSINPKTNSPYGLTFPSVSIGDMVELQKKLLDHLGIAKLLAIIGGSMGGMLTLQWVAKYPTLIHAAIPIATTIKHSPQQIAFNEVARQAIMSDPAWNNGDYYKNEHPLRGLALARMIGHITYMSNQSMEKKFSRRLQSRNNDDLFQNDFEVEGYLKYKGDNFVKRFDANSYLYISKAMDYFDLSEGRLISYGKVLNTKFLVISFGSDWLYPSSQSLELVKFLKNRLVDVTYCEIPSTYGHDAVLIEVSEQSHLIKHFLEKVEREFGDE